MLESASRAGSFGGAALDVFLGGTAGSGVAALADAAVVHLAAFADASPQSLERGLELFLANLRRFKNGEPLHHVVDRTAGY